VFLAPWALAAAAAQQIRRFVENPWLRAFGAGAAPAVVGILGVTVLDIAREAFTSWTYTAIAAAAFALAAWTRTHPVGLLAGGAVLGWLLGT
jgi:chromate transporter